MTPFFIIPAKAGIQSILGRDIDSVWIPAFAGMTARVRLAA